MHSKMAHIDSLYQDLVNTIMRDGYRYADKSRGSIGMLEIPSYTLDIDMAKGFPLLTTKRISWKTVLHELIWMLSGATDINYLQSHKVHIWNKDALAFSGTSYVGRIYGAQWRTWTASNGFHLDQIKDLLTSLKTNLYTRRHLVTAWNPAELDNMALPPCHWAFQVLPTKDGFALKWIQRSCDVFLGIPFDIALYGFIGLLIEHETGLKFTRLIGDLSCAHFYEPHIKLVQSQMAREPIIQKTEVKLDQATSFDDLSLSSFTVSAYESHRPIKAEMYAKQQQQ